MKTFHGTTESFEIYTGVRQGDALSPILFNFVLEAALSNMDKRGNISNRLKQICAYVDNVAIIARTKKVLIETFEILVKDAKKRGLIINQTKTKYRADQKQVHSITVIIYYTLYTYFRPTLYMQNSKKNTAMKDMKIGQMKFEQVKSFKYLGTQLNSQNSTHEETQYRLILGDKALYANKQLLSSTLISRNAKLKICKSLMWKLDLNNSRRRKTKNI